MVGAIESMNMAGHQYTYGSFLRRKEGRRDSRICLAREWDSGGED